jgi:hypothetical protein
VEEFLLLLKSDYQVPTYTSYCCFKLSYKNLTFSIKFLTHIDLCYHHHQNTVWFHHPQNAHLLSAIIPGPHGNHLPFSAAWLCLLDNAIQIETYRVYPLCHRFLTYHLHTLIMPDNVVFLFLVELVVKFSRKGMHIQWTERPSLERK